MTKLMHHLFLAIAAAALIAGPGLAAEPLQACQGKKLKAAGAYGKKVAGCVAKAIKKGPTFGESLVADALDQCRVEQLPAFASKWLKTEAKAVGRSATNCLGADAFDIDRVVGQALQRTLDVAFSGVSSPADDAGRGAALKLLGSLVKNSGNYGKKWLSAEQKNLGSPRNPDAATAMLQTDPPPDPVNPKSATSRAKARVRYEQGWERAGAKAARRSITSTSGAPTRSIEADFQSIAALILAEDRPVTEKDEAEPTLPALYIDPPVPIGGELATLHIDVPGASSISVSAEGDGCGAFGADSFPGPTVSDTRTVGSFGSCEIYATTTVGGLPESYGAQFTVQPTEVPLPDATLLGGLFVPGTLPPQTGSPDDPTPISIEAPGAIVTGGTAQIRLQMADVAAAQRVSIVRVQVGVDSGGYFEAPAFVVGDTVIVEVQLSKEALISMDITFFFQLRDSFSNLGPIAQLPIAPLLVGTGDVQVSLAWNSATDVDLHVIEPSDEEIYYGHRASATGGALDTDSNAGCSIDGRNQENISWPVGSAPDGEYVVRVDFWSDCDTSGADYVVTTDVCGDVDTFRGAFSQGTSDRGGEGSGFEVTRFEANCQFRARGFARYEDRPQTTNGWGTPTPLPIRLANVEIQRVSDGAVLGRGQTLLNGFFDVRFENDGPPGYQVVVIAKQEGTVLPQLVKEQGSLGLGAIYAISSPITDELMMPDAVDFELLAKADEAGPAFNIFDVGLRAQTFVRGINGGSAPYLEWLWTRGDIGSCGPPIFRNAVTCYSYALGEISVLSIPADSDEYDDTVLLHEFGHHWQAYFSRNSSSGGAHSSSNYVDAQLAFSEGAATFFGQSVAGTDIYLDTRGAQTSSRSIENIAFRVPQGTSDFTIRGDLSEAVVDGILWDLADSTNEGRDTITNRAAAFAALGKLRPFFYGDRATFGADLVDLLDKWFCLGHGMRGDANSGVQGILALNNNFPYDFPAVVPCN